MYHLLTILWLLPLLGAAAVLVIANRWRIPPVAIRFTALGTCLLTLLLSVAVFGCYHWDRDLQTGDVVGILSSHERGTVRAIDSTARQVTLEIGNDGRIQKLGIGEVKLIGAYAYSTGGQSADGGGELGVVQWAEHATWIPPFHAEYRVGVDGLSLPLIVLTALIFTAACAASSTIGERIAGYFALLLLLESTMLGLFLSLDLFLFLLFFELSLVPVYFLISIRGGLGRENAAMRFFILALAGSVPLLIAVIVVERNAHTLDMVELSHRLAATFGPGTSAASLTTGLFALFMLSFLIRMGAPPLHAGATVAIAESPAPLAMILSTLFPAGGGYAILRIAYPFFPQAGAHCWLAVAILGVFAILFGSLCALSEPDLRKWVTYLSISQLGYVTLGAAMMTTAALSGALFMMVSQGIVIGMLIFLAALIVQRAGHRRIGVLGALAGGMPRLRVFMFVVCFAALGLPGLCGFIGQMMVLIGSFQAVRPDSVLVAGHFASPRAVCAICAVACLGPVLMAAAVLGTLRRMAFGTVEPGWEAAADLDERETGILAPLAALAIVLGVVPNLAFFAMTQKTIEAIGASVERGADPRGGAD